MLHSSGPCELESVFLLVHGVGGLQTNLQLAAFQCEIESGLVLAHKVDCNLCVALLLQMGNNRLTDQVRVAKDLQDLVIAALGHSLLESIRGSVDGNGPRLAISVEAVHIFTLNAGQVDGLLQDADKAAVALRKSMLDMVQRRINEDSAIIPCSALDANLLVNEAYLLQRLYGNRDRMLAPQGNIQHISRPKQGAWRAESSLQR